MKRHKIIESDKLVTKLRSVLFEIYDLRFLSIIGHQYVEYFINEIICIKFKNPDLIIDDNELGGFNNKFTLLKSMEFFKGRSDLEKNIKLINIVRNFYAHNMLHGDEVPLEIINRINEMKYLKEAHPFDDKEYAKMDIKNKFVLCCTSTIVSLSHMALVAKQS